jgi:hypothetical protein
VSLLVCQVRHAWRRQACRRTWPPLTALPVLGLTTRAVTLTAEPRLIVRLLAVPLTLGVTAGVLAAAVTAGVLATAAIGAAEAAEAVETTAAPAMTSLTQTPRTSVSTSLPVPAEDARRCRPELSPCTVEIPPARLRG